MAENITLARPYAQAVFNLAKESDSLAKWSEAFIALVGVTENTDVQNLIANPAVEPADKAEIIAKAAGLSGNKETGLLGLLAKNGRLSILPEVAGLFEQLKNKEENTENVEITSAVALTEEQLETFKAKLTKRFGKEVHIETQVDESILGGAIIRAGSEVIDGSVKTKLERLATQVAQ